MNIAKSPNINYLWSQLIVEELIRNGVDYFCISPGSRSTPLAFAVAQHKKTKTAIHFDERGSAFHALGYISATKKPCALITTSGTAVANLFPAVIETSKKKLPLIILTADRPPELHFTGAHQTIDQVKIFGDYVRWYFEMPCPNKEIPPEFVLTTIDQAIHKAKSHLSGPVHLNCMFREPLTPIRKSTSFTSYLSKLKRWMTAKDPYTRYIQQDHTLDSKTLKQIVSALRNIKTGVIVVGKTADTKERTSILKIVQKLNWPVFPDISSGLRLGNTHPNVIHYFDQLLLSQKITKKFKPDGILHLGGRITSKRWYEFISKLALNEYVMVLNHPLRNDPLHNVTLRVESPIGLLCEKLSFKIKKRLGNPLLNFLQKANRNIDQTISKHVSKSNLLTEPNAARFMTEIIPSHHGLFLASSLPIREVDMYGVMAKQDIPIGSNRGASGIDGTIASAVGFSNGLKKPVTLLIGDLAFLYDLNSLSMLRELKYPMTIVLLNNNGGGIFSFLPISEYKEVFEKYFGTPHHLDFKHAAAQFRLEYKSPKQNDEFIKDYQRAVSGVGMTLIEICNKRSQNVRIHNELQRKIIKNVNTMK